MLRNNLTDAQLLLALVSWRAQTFWALLCPSEELSLSSFMPPPRSAVRPWLLVEHKSEMCNRNYSLHAYLWASPLPVSGPSCTKPSSAFVCYRWPSESCYITGVFPEWQNIPSAHSAVYHMPVRWRNCWFSYCFRGKATCTCDTLRCRSNSCCSLWPSHIRGLLVTCAPMCGPRLTAMASQLHLGQPTG